MINQPLKTLLPALGAIYFSVLACSPLLHPSSLLSAGGGFVRGSIIASPGKDTYQSSSLTSLTSLDQENDSPILTPLSSRRQARASHPYDPQVVKNAPLRGVGTPVFRATVYNSAAAYATLVPGASDGNLSFTALAGVTKYPKLYDVSLGLDYAIDTAEPDDAVYDTNNASSLNFTRPDNGSVVSYPIAGYAIIPCYNIPELNSSNPPLKLAKETLANIFFGAVKYWDDPQILATNPNLAAKLPHIRITLVIRGDPFTMNKIILKGLATFNSTFSSRVPPSSTPDWCEGAPVTQIGGDPKRELLVSCAKSNGDDLRMYLPLTNALMLTRLKAQPYTLGFVSSQNAQDLSAAMLSNHAGEFVMPTTTSVVFAAMDRGTLLDSHWRASLLSPSTPQAWPLCSYVYLLVRAKSHISSCESRQRMLLFWSWFIYGAESQQLLTSFGLAPLPRFLQILVISQMNEEIKCVAGCASVCTCANKPSACIYPFPDAATVPITIHGADSVTASIMQLIFHIYTTRPESNNVILEYQQKDSAGAFYDLIYRPNSVDMALTMFDARDMRSILGTLTNKLIAIPFVTLATVPIYHCSGIDGNSFTLTPTILAEIYLGTIIMWNDPLIVAANPDLVSLLPNSTINIITRSDQSFTTEMFTRYLSSQHDGFREKIGVVRSLNPSWLGANNRTVLVADSDDTVEGMLLEWDLSLGFGRLSPNVDIAQLAINISDPPGKYQREVTIVANTNNILSCAHDPANIEQVGRYSWVVNPVKSTLVNEEGSGDFLKADSTSKRSVAHSETASDAVEMACYPITGTFELILHLQDSSSSFSDFSNGYNDDSLSTSSSAAAASQQASCGNRRQTLEFLDWLYSTGSGLSTAMYSYGAAFPSIQVQQLAKDALLQVRCDGISYLATPVPCIYADDMYFNISNSCSGPEGGREIKFFWTKGDERLCRGGDMLPKDMEIPCEYVEVTSGLGTVVTVLSMLGVVFCGFFLFWTYKHRHAKIVTFSQRSFLIAFVLCAAGLNLVGLLFLGENSDALCLARPWLLNILSTLTFTILYMKLRRVYVLFSVAALKKVKISNSQVAVQILMTVAVDILILIVWTAASRPRSVIITLEIQGVGLVEVSECGSPYQEIFAQIMHVWKALLLVYGGYLSKLSWDIDTKFSEAKHIAVSIYNTMMIAAVAVVMGFLPVPANVLVLCRALACAVAANGSVGMVMIPKLYLINQENPSSAAVELANGSKTLATQSSRSPTSPNSRADGLSSSVVSNGGSAMPRGRTGAINENMEVRRQSLSDAGPPVALGSYSTVSGSQRRSSTDTKLQRRSHSVSSIHVAPDTDPLVVTTASENAD